MRKRRSSIRGRYICDSGLDLFDNLNVFWVHGQEDDFGGLIKKSRPSPLGPQEGIRSESQDVVVNDQELFVG